MTSFEDHSKLAALVAAMAKKWGIDDVRPIDKCIFVSGIPRSGTTACQKILVEALRTSDETSPITRSRVSVMESFYFESEANPENEYFWRSKLAFLGGDTRHADFFNFIQQRQLVEHIRKTHDLDLTANALSRLYMDLSRQYHNLLIPCEKTPSNILFARRIFQMSRHALIIFMIRHPASVLTSLRRRSQLNSDSSKWLNMSLEEFSWFYKYYIDDYYQMKRRFGRRVQLFRFEDVADDNDMIRRSVESVLGDAILKKEATSRLTSGESHVAADDLLPADYYAVQARILTHTLDYLGYGQRPSQ